MGKFAELEHDDDRIVWERRDAKKDRFRVWVRYRSLLSPLVAECPLFVRSISMAQASCGAKCTGKPSGNHKTDGEEHYCGPTVRS